jgi:putative restriction endonuclease
MNPLERILIEKAGREHGFENVLPGQDNAVVLGSARHRVQVEIIVENRIWLLKLPAGLLTHELERSFPRVEFSQGQFIAPSIDLLTQLLSRAAALAQSLPNQAEIDYEAEVQKTLAKLPPNGTEIERMVRQRIGQNTFRNAMMDYWGQACSVTGISVPEVLRASHAKPWADCDNDAERLDVFNGFLLVANLDAMFDCFLISFDDNGAMLVSPRLTMEQRLGLRLNQNLCLRWLAEEHLPYLHYHRRLLLV